MKPIKGYNVYRNGVFKTFIFGRSSKCRKSYIQHTMASTHMGEWRRTLTIAPENPSKTSFEYEYATTIGVYFKFQPAMSHKEKIKL